MIYNSYHIISRFKGEKPFEDDNIHLVVENDARFTSIAS